jgi:hypothetical protein
VARIWLFLSGRLSLGVLETTLKFVFARRLGARICHADRLRQAGKLAFAAPRRPR